MPDYRVQYNERNVGAGHPLYADTLNRLALIEHNNDGTHKALAPDVKFASQYATLSAAITAIGATETTLIVASSINASNSAEAVIVPATMAILPLKPGVVAKGSATSLTINGPVVGNPMHKWLSGFGVNDVTFGAGAVRDVLIDWFWSGSGDAYTAIMTAYNSLVVSGGRVMPLHKTYNYGTTLSFIEPGVDVVGIAKGKGYGEDGARAGTVFNFTGTGIAMHIGVTGAIGAGTDWIYGSEFGNFIVRVGTTNCTHGMRVRYAHDVIVHDITIEEGAVAGQYPTTFGFSVIGCVSGHFYDLYINGGGSGGTADGIELGAMTGIALTASKFDRIRSRSWARDGMYISGDVQGCQFNNINLESNGRYGLKITDVNKVNSYNNFWFENNTSYDIAFVFASLTSQYQYFKNTFFNCPASRSRYVLLASLDNTTFDGNYYVDNNANGFADHGASLGKITMLNDDKYWSGYVYPTTAIKPDKKQLHCAWHQVVSGGETNSTFVRLQGSGTRYYVRTTGWLEAFTAYCLNAPGASQSYTVKLFINGSETITDSIGGTALHVEKALGPDQVRLAAGDYITAHVVSTSGTPASNDVYIDAIVSYV